MTQRIAYYQIMYGLPGCIPNSHEFAEWHKRGDMVKGIEALLSFYDFPQRARRQIDLVQTWRYIQTGGNKAHFVIRGNDLSPCNLEFVQIGRAEYLAALESESFC